MHIKCWFRSSDSSSEASWPFTLTKPVSTVKVIRQFHQHRHWISMECILRPLFYQLSQTDFENTSAVSSSVRKAGFRMKLQAFQEPLKVHILDSCKILGKKYISVSNLLASFIEKQFKFWTFKITHILTRSIPILPITPCTSTWGLVYNCNRYNYLVFCCV